jgi:hypothetical protein
MNMFRDLLTLALIAIGISLVYGDPNSWQWPDSCGPYVAQAVTFLADARPWSVVISLVLALSLFLTRLKY